MKSPMIDFHTKYEMSDLNQFSVIINSYFSRVMRKPAFCICENKGVDQLPSNCAADLPFFSYIDSTVPLLPKFKI